MATSSKSNLYSQSQKMSEIHVVGTTPFGNRRVAPISGGTFEGPEVSGIVLSGGADWMTVDPAGAWFRINVQVPLRTQDGEFLTLAYQGFRSGPPEVLERVSRGEPYRCEQLLLPRDWLVRDGIAETRPPQYGGCRRPRLEDVDRTWL